MGCFIAPVAEAIIVTVASKSLKLKEENELKSGKLLSTRKKLRWLSSMLWGGSALLAFEHFFHGEIVPFFPFFTAATSYASFLTMLKEIATVGVAMSILITLLWAVFVGIVSIWEKRIISNNLEKKGN